MFTKEEQKLSSKKKKTFLCWAFWWKLKMKAHNESSAGFSIFWMQKALNQKKLIQKKLSTRKKIQLEKALKQEKLKSLKSYLWQIF